MDEISILCNPTGIQHEQHTVLFTDTRNFSCIGHTYRLTTSAVVGNRKDNRPHLICAILDDTFLQPYGVHIPLEGMKQRRVQCLLNG